MSSPLSSHHGGTLSSHQAKEEVGTAGSVCWPSAQIFQLRLSMSKRSQWPQTATLSLRVLCGHPLLLWEGTCFLTPSSSHWLVGYKYTCRSLMVSNIVLLDEGIACPTCWSHLGSWPYCPWCQTCPAFGTFVICYLTSTDRKYLFRVGP